ncbi:hypothetical protein [Parabacteroides sp.]
MKNFDNILLMLLSPSEAVLLMVLMERAGDGDKKDDYVAISNKTLEVLTNVPSSRVYSIIGNLEKLDFVGVPDEKGNNNTWKYCVKHSNVNKVIETIKSFNPNSVPLVYSKDNTAIHNTLEYCESYRRSCGLEALKDIRKRKGKPKTNSGDNTTIDK